MTIEELYETLTQTGLPVAYDSFEDFDDSPAPTPPYIVFIETGRNPFYADDTVYAEIKIINISLYTKRKSLEYEKLVEDTLKSNGIFYTFNEPGLIESEDIYEVTYNIEIV